METTDKIELNDLLGIEGVGAAFEYTPDGKLVDCRMRANLSPEADAQTARLCTVVTMLFNTTDDPFAQVGEVAQAPVDLAVADDEWLVVTGGGHGVIAHGDRTSVAELTRALGC